MALNLGLATFSTALDLTGIKQGQKKAQTWMNQNPLRLGVKLAIDNASLQRIKSNLMKALGPSSEAIGSSIGNQIASGVSKGIAKAGTAAANARAGEAAQERAHQQRMALEAQRFANKEILQQQRLDAIKKIAADKAAQAQANFDKAEQRRADGAAEAKVKTAQRAAERIQAQADAADRRSAARAASQAKKDQAEIEAKAKRDQKARDTADAAAAASAKRQAASTANILSGIAGGIFGKQSVSIAKVFDSPGTKQALNELGQRYYSTISGSIVGAIARTNPKILAGIAGGLSTASPAIGRIFQNLGTSGGQNLIQSLANSLSNGGGGGGGGLKGALASFGTKAGFTLMTSLAASVGGMAVNIGGKIVSGLVGVAGSMVKVGADFAVSFMKGFGEGVLNLGKSIFGNLANMAAKTVQVAVQQVDRATDVAGSIDMNSKIASQLAFDQGRTRGETIVDSKGVAVADVAAADKAFRRQAIDLGASPTLVVTPGEVAEAQKMLATGGKSFSFIQSSLENIIRLANITGNTLKQTTGNILDITAQTDFKKGAKDAAEVAARERESIVKIFSTVASGRVNLDDLAQTIKYSRFGDGDFKTLQDQLTMGSLQANAGLRGSTAGTGASALFESIDKLREVRGFGSLSISNADGSKRTELDILKDTITKYKELRDVKSKASQDLRAEVGLTGSSKDAEFLNRLDQDVRQALNARGLNYLKKLSTTDIGDRDGQGGMRTGPSKDLLIAEKISSSFEKDLKDIAVTSVGSGKRLLEGAIESAQATIGFKLGPLVDQIYKAFGEALTGFAKSPAWERLGQRIQVAIAPLNAIVGKDEDGNPAKAISKFQSIGMAFANSIENGLQSIVEWFVKMLTGGGLERTVAALSSIASTLGVIVGFVFRIASGAAELLTSIITSPGFSNLMQFIQQGVNSAFSAVRPLIADIAQVIPPILSAVISVIKPIVPIVGDLIRAAGPIIAQIISTVGQSLPGIITSLGDVIVAAKPLLFAIGNLALKILQGLPDLIEGITPYIQKFAEVLAPIISGIPKMFDGIAKVTFQVGGFLDKLFPRMDLLAEQTVRIGKNLTQSNAAKAVNNSGPGIFSTITQGFLGGLGGAGAQFLADNGANFALLGTQLLQTVASIASFVGQIVGLVIRIVSVISSFLVPILNTALGIVNLVLSALEGVFRIISTIASNGLQALGAVITPIMDSTFGLLNRGLTGVVSTVNVASSQISAKLSEGGIWAANKIQQGWDSIDWRGGWQRFSDGAGAATNGAAKAVEGLAGFIGSINLGAVWQKFIDGAKWAATGVFEFFFGAAASAAEPAGAAAGTTAGTAATAATAGAENAGSNWMSQFVSGFADGFVKVSQSLYNLFIKPFTDGITAIAQAFTWLTQGIATGMANAWTNTSNFFFAPFNAAIGAVSSWVGTLVNWVSSLAGWLWTKVNEVYFTPMQSAIDVMSSWIGSLINWLSGLAGWLWTKVNEVFFTPLKAAIQQMLTWITSISKWISSTATWIFTQVKDAGGKALTWIGNKVSNIVEYGKKLFGDWAGSLQKVFSGPMEWLTSKFSFIFDGIKNAVGLGGANTAGSVDSSGIASNPDQFVGAVLSILESGSRQGRVDVAQVIANRVGTNFGGYGGNIRDQAFASGQFQPFFKETYGIGKGDIRDQDTAIKALVKAGYSQSSAMEALNNFWADVRNSAMVADSQAKVAGRAYFKGVSERKNMAAGDFLRSTALTENFFHHENSDMVNRKVGSVESLFGVTKGGGISGMAGAFKGLAGTVNTSGYRLYTTGGGTSTYSAGGTLRNHHNMSGAYTNEADGRRTTTRGTAYDMTLEDASGSLNVPVPSPLSGTVFSAGLLGGYGNAVQIRDAQGNTALIAHMASLAVSEGQQIAEGQKLGIQGGTGAGGVLRLPVHVHIETSPAIAKRYADRIASNAYKASSGGGGTKPVSIENLGVFRGGGGTNAAANTIVPGPATVKDKGTSSATNKAPASGATGTPAKSVKIDIKKAVNRIVDRVNPAADSANYDKRGLSFGFTDNKGFLPSTPDNSPLLDLSKVLEDYSSDISGLKLKGKKLVEITPEAKRMAEIRKQLGDNSQLSQVEEAEQRIKKLKQSLGDAEKKRVITDSQIALSEQEFKNKRAQREKSLAAQTKKNQEELKVLYARFGVETGKEILPNGAIAQEFTDGLEKFKSKTDPISEALISKNPKDAEVMLRQLESDIKKTSVGKKIPEIQQRRLLLLAIAQKQYRQASQRYRGLDKDKYLEELAKRQQASFATFLTGIERSVLEKEYTLARLQDQKRNLDQNKELDAKQLKDTNEKKKLASTTTIRNITDQIKEAELDLVKLKEKQKLQDELELLQAKKQEKEDTMNDPAFRQIEGYLRSIGYDPKYEDVLKLWLRAKAITKKEEFIPSKLDENVRQALFEAGIMKGGAQVLGGRNIKFPTSSVYDTAAYRSLYSGTKLGGLQFGSQGVDRLVSTGNMLDYTGGAIGNVVRDSTPISYYGGGGSRTSSGGGKMVFEFEGIEEGKLYSAQQIAKLESRLNDPRFADTIVGAVIQRIEYDQVTRSNIGLR